MVVEFREAMVRAKTFAKEEFKSSSDFLGAVEDAASKYFGEGFDFCKWQIRRHHPYLSIDLEGMGLYHDLLAEEDEGDEVEKEGKTLITGRKTKATLTPILFEHLFVCFLAICNP